jgi:outer membrane protein OmpA-like peptidoglycan-associated protein
MQYLWKDYLFRVHTIQERQDIRQMSFLELKNFYNTYFLPQNSLLFIRTQKEPYALFDRLSPFVNGADMGRNAYNSLGKTNIYRNLINSVQVIERDTSNSYRNASLMWQVVGDLRDGNSYLCADLYKDLLNQWFDEGKLGNNAITNLHASLYTQRFMCELRVDFSLSGTEKAAVYELKEKLNNLKIDSLCTNENLMSMLTQRLAAQELSYSDPQRYSESLALWWDLHGTDYALNMDKNLKSISRADIQRFYTLFVKDRPTVFSLKTKSNLTGTDYLAEANDTIVKTFIAFDNNMSEITEQRSKNTLISILQYLTANPDINVRVNGLADSKEFLKADAKDLEPFLQKYPMFKVISANPGKSTWQRLDMVRALRIVKFLISNGISPERINGSGMIAKNNDEEDVATHRIVSFTFDKIRKHASQISSAP